MEAIHYALYGMALRPSKNAGNDDIISYGRDKAIVELEFSIDDAQYQVRRELIKNKTNVHILNKRGKNGGLSRVTTGARNVNYEINQILHGIDSDALLNSCLVEQKELGKLEDSNKQERIKAMSQLLNLEAFVDSRDEIKKECGELEKIHLHTLNKLNEAERIKTEYEQAEKEKEVAEKRLNEIEKEKIIILKKLEKIQNELEIIKNMKSLQNKINEYNTKLDSTQKELLNQKDRLEEIRLAEIDLSEIEAKLPSEENKLLELNQKLEFLKQLNQNENILKQRESKLENIEVRLTEMERQFNEASSAKNRLNELKDKLVLYDQIKDAQPKIERISNLNNNLNFASQEAEKLVNEIESIIEKIDESKETEHQIDSLKNREEQAKKARKKTQQLKNGGILLFVLALPFLFYTIISANLLVIILGVLIFASGGYLFISNNPNSIELEIDQIRHRRENLISEVTRLQSYRETKTGLDNKLKGVKEKKSVITQELFNTVKQLPEQPRRYDLLIDPSKPDSFNDLRIQFQEDVETFTRMITEKDGLQKKADILGTVKVSLETLQQDKKIAQNEINETINKISEIENKSDLTSNQEEKIRKQYTDVKASIARLYTQKANCQKTINKRDHIINNINEITNEINLLKATIKQEEKKFKELEVQGVYLADEPTLSNDRDNTLRKTASLEREVQERATDIIEANEVLAKNQKIKDEYPILFEESTREKFRIEAMRRATILLDTTRDTIMSGVKQNVEKNMMQFLPTLTDNRYNLARIDETNYRIEIYDREAKTWRIKGVFSGATQDQFSLALRLAFAISTIPSSRGARPGFIFLDEPLSGFDSQRRNGFMQLLKEDLSRHFDQIIVISHIEALVEDFPNNLNFDSGKILEVQR